MFKKTTSGSSPNTRFSSNIISSLPQAGLLRWLCVLVQKCEEKNLFLKDGTVT
jgi:hypothetical protein